ncbi:hypothetical protein Cp1R7AA1_235 [Mesorhizobium phage Cp1R7A-A1]|nr:hypothetical protein Cp1R7AA1_235 [Mesorhizobium phage Cp1R7A-A1]
MRTIIDITWGNPKLENGCVVIPFSMHCTDDVSPGDTPNNLFFQASTMSFMPMTIAKGQAEIEAAIGRIMEEQRDEYGAISLGRFRESAIDYTRKRDLTALIHPQWAKAEPYRPTHH